MYNVLQVEVMARKMDSLLEAIGGAGGFRDASTTSQEDSVVALEEGLWTISERCRMWSVSLCNRSHLSLSLSILYTYALVWIHTSCLASLLFVLYEASLSYSSLAVFRPTKVLP